MAKRLNTLLRHGELPREEDGAIEFWRLKDDLRNKFEHSPQYWSDDVWKSKMARGGGNKKRFQYCTDSSEKRNSLPSSSSRPFKTQSHRPITTRQCIDSEQFLRVHLSYWMCGQCTLHNKFRIDSGRTKSSKDRQTIFFTAENPMHKNHQDPQEVGLTKPRLASYKQKWKVHQDTVYWVDVQLTQRKGLKFNQTRSNAVILYDTLPACCISKAIVMKSEDIIYQKVYVSPRPPPTISYKDNWMCDLDSDVARSSKDIQRIEPKPNTQLSSTERPVTKGREETLERTKFDRDTLNHVTDPKSTGKPVCGHESTKRCVLTPKHVENDQTGTGRPVTVDQKEEHEIDFRVPGLSHSVVKEAEHLRVQELVKRIENHLHREALHADLQQNNVCSPFSNKSKAMIRELGNVELFGLYETTPKVQCSHCLLYCNQGFVYCTCGQCLIDSESRRKFNKLRLECTLYPELRDKERRHPWCSTRQDRGAKRIPLGLECVEEML